MKCIMCGEDLKFKAGGAPLYNVDAYGKPAKAKTECCGNVLMIYPKRSFDFVNLPDQKEKSDDWGY